MFSLRHYAPPAGATFGVARATLRTLTTTFVLASLLASAMPAAADTGRPGNPCSCVTGNNQQQPANPTGGRAVINEDLSAGDEVVVEFVPSDLPAERAQPAVSGSGQGPTSGGTTAVDGGNVSNDTSIAVDASGGDADAAASGGDFNIVNAVNTGGNTTGSAGNGGDAAAAAGGGTVVLGNVNSGANQGSQISVDQMASGKVLCFLPDGKAVVEVPAKFSAPAGGNVAVDGGNVSNNTDIAVDASGGNASSDASGGDGNVVVISGGSGNANASAGNGGNASSDASGGTVSIGNVNSGGNTGNVINVGSTGGDKKQDREQRRAERRGNQNSPCLPPPCPAANVAVDGGNVSNETDIAVDASGGDASADASGGSNNTVEATNTGGNVIVSAGNGGNAAADATGGVVEIGTVRSGGNSGNQVNFTNVGGQVLCVTNSSLVVALDLPAASSQRRTRDRDNVVVDGGNVSNETTISVNAAGGNASTDASGGNGNIVVSGGRGNSSGSAGNGGNASSDASGGTIVIGDINSGGNSGNDIDD